MFIAFNFKIRVYFLWKPQNEIIFTYVWLIFLGGCFLSPHHYIYLFSCCWHQGQVLKRILRILGKRNWQLPWRIPSRYRLSHFGKGFMCFRKQHENRDPQGSGGSGWGHMSAEKVSTSPWGIGKMNDTRSWQTLLHGAGYTISGIISSWQREWCRNRLQV